MHAARSAALALLLLTVAIAGCNAVTDSPDTNDPTDTATPIPASTPTQTPHDPAMRYTTQNSNLGEDEKPHSIRIFNDRNETVDSALIQITRYAADSNYATTDTYSVTLGPGDDHYGVIDYKANYTATVIVRNQNATEGNPHATERIPPTVFDCNDSSTVFYILEKAIISDTLSTSLRCSTASSE